MEEGEVKEASRRHVAWARDQFLAVALCHHRRCGRRSPARVLPHPVLVDVIGRELVMSPCKTVSVNVRVVKYSPVPTVVCVGVSFTLGVTWLRERQEDGSFQTCFEDGVLEMRSRGSDYDLVMKDWGTGLERVEWRGGGFFLSEVMRNDKWMLVEWKRQNESPSKKPEERLLLPVLGANVRGECRSVMAPQGVHFKWIAMLDGDDAIVSTLPLSGDHKLKETLWRVNLRETYNTSQFVPIAQIPGYTSNMNRQIEMMSNSRENGLIAAVCDQRYGYEGRNSCQLIRLRPNSKSRELLRGGRPKPFRIDSSHWLEAVSDDSNPSNVTLRLFSTEDLDNPIREFTYPDAAQVSCSNGFIVFLVRSKPFCHIDIVDALSGAWILRHPLPLDSDVIAYLDGHELPFDKIAAKLEIPELLRGGRPKPLRIDSSHWLEAVSDDSNPSNVTLRLFSTEDLDNPICDNKPFCHIDIVDALSGSWLFRHPLPLDRFVYASFDRHDFI
ncbi:hypothetical protein Pelo_2734 [Pelomyxa schiedti]|nr:hypothetical protein Pelo_2734 [Pelomyxa schiedti]